jgi:hypothetical protein
LIKVVVGQVVEQLGEPDGVIAFAQFIGVCSSVDTCSKEEGRGKGRGEKAYKAIAEEQRALHSRGEAAYTVNGLQRG